MWTCPKIVSENVLTKVQQFQYIAKNFESWSTRKQIENINDFVDMIIAEVRSFLVKYGFDPMNIPDIDEEIEITGVPIHLKLNDGVIFNASSIYRDGDINLYYENRLLVVEVPIFFKVFKMDYEYDIAVSSDGSLLEGKLNGEVVLVDVNFAVQVDFKALQISLKSYSISNIGAINIDFWKVACSTGFCKELLIM
ncbi:uncharacterized protein [Atheta coriaria]|uniref:uncharacterized protein n=1 Tax=Dalotia coriaria TaxID=877792 RepID=UPI0031F389E3